MNSIFKISFGCSLLIIIAVIVFQTIENHSQNQTINQTINQQIKLAEAVKKENLNLNHQKISNQTKPNKQTLQNITLNNDNRNDEINNQTINDGAQIEQVIEPVFSDFNLKLLAIAEIGKNKLASIQLENQKNFYRTDQLINPKLKLSQIEKDYVLIEYLNQNHRLDIAVQDLNSQIESIDRVQNPEEEIKNQILHFQKMIQADPYALIGVIGIKNYQKSGVKGYQLRANIDKKLFQELGFKDGDVVIAINNLSITDQMNLEKIYQDLTTKKQFVIKLIRNGVPIEYLLNLS